MAPCLRKAAKCTSRRRHRGAALQFSSTAPPPAPSADETECTVCERREDRLVLKCQQLRGEQRATEENERVAADA